MGLEAVPTSCVTICMVVGVLSDMLASYMDGVVWKIPTS